MSGPSSVPKDNAPIIETWRRLPALARLDFTATPGPASQTGWRGRGEAVIETETDASGIRLHETGTFTPAATDTPVAFRNVYHWRRDGDRLALAHERFGRDRPVWLFDLVADTPHALVAAAAHACGADRYAATLRLQPDGFELRWHIRGPAKDERLCYRYRAG